MVERAAQAANTIRVVDFIQFSAKFTKIKSAKLANLYRNNGLSTRQIAAEIGCSKTFVLSRLHENGVDTSADRRTAPDNYRVHETPYGFSRRNGKLVPNRREMKVIRLIVHLRINQKLSFVNIGKELEKRGIKNRAGRVRWLYCAVKKYFHRWKEKI